MCDVVFITGTPCVGKTSIASKLNGRLFKINDIAINNDFILGIDDTKGYKIIDIEKLNEHIQSIIQYYDETLLFEGHLSHLCQGATKVIVLRVRPEILKTRLQNRNYSKDKIQENLEAEALGVCSIEAFENYGNKVQEIDVSDLKIDDAVDLVEKVINGEINFPAGNVDFTDWIL